VRFTSRDYVWIDESNRCGGKQGDGGWREASFAWRLEAERRFDSVDTYITCRPRLPSADLQNDTFNL
jgi:hypothetical protein